MKRVLVTGAGGFVGRAVVRHLASSGWEVTGLVRSTETIPGTAALVRVAGLHDRDALRSAMRQAEAVVHLAARVHVMRESAKDPLAAFREVNVEGTRTVLELALEAGVQRFVYVSSVKVHGEGRETPYRADDVLAPADPYGVSKREAEEVVAATSTAALRWTIVRPPLVYGPGVGGNFRRLLRLARLSCYVPLPLGNVRNRRSLIYVDNLADALARILATDAAAGRRYLVADPETLSTSTLLGRLAAALGGRALLLPCPMDAIRLLARLSGRAAEAERLLGSLTVDASPISEELEWRAPVPMDTALALTAASWRAEGAA